MKRMEAYFQIQNSLIGLGETHLFAVSESKRYGNIMPVEAKRSSAWYSAGRTWSASTRLSERSAASARAEAMRTLKNCE